MGPVHGGCGGLGDCSSLGPELGQQQLRQGAELASGGLRDPVCPVGACGVHGQVRCIHPPVLRIQQYFQNSPPLFFLGAVLPRFSAVFMVSS